MTVRIVLADDHAVVREGLRALLSTVADYVVVGEASTGAEAVRAAVTERPDVLVMDIQMPGQNGIEATREIARAAPEVAVLMLTMFDDDESLFAAMRAGALGYVLKGAAPDSIIRAIGAVAEGEAIFSPGVARRTLSFLHSRVDSVPAFPELTARERDVLGLIAGGESNAAIARSSCSRRTRSATTSRAFSPSCRSPVAPRRSSERAAKASAELRWPELVKAPTCPPSRWPNA